MLPQSTNKTLNSYMSLLRPASVTLPMLFDNDDVRKQLKN